jgi:hypothetical protein
MAEDEVEFRWQYYLLHPLPHPDACESPSRRMVKARDKLKRRIEDVLRDRIVVTSDGEFFRFEGDKRVNQWILEVKRFDQSRNERLLKLLSKIERLVFDQVRCPDAAAHLYAKVEGARGWNMVGTWPEKMTPYCLAGGAGFDLELFISTLKSVAQFLKSPRPV